MELINYINEHPNEWRQTFAAEPYFFRIEDHGIYTFINTTFRSIKTSTFSREAHGVVIRPNETNQMICVNYPFNHVPYYNQEEAFISDWKKSKVSMHMDGILICLWSDKGHWHLSSDIEFDLEKIECKNGYNAQQIFNSVVNNISDLTTTLSPEFCYSFILSSPNCNNFTNYDGSTHLYYITRRNIHTLDEDNQKPAFNCEVRQPYPFPKINYLPYLLGVQEQLRDVEMGFIVVDPDGNRIRVDNLKWIEMQEREKVNQNLSTEYIVNLWQKNGIQEHVQTYGENVSITLIVNCLETLCTKAEQSFVELKDRSKNSLKSFMRKLPRHLPCTSGYMTERWYGRAENTAEEYFKNSDIKDLMQDLQYEIITRRQHQ